MTLDAVEFLRRFFLHVLPKGFARIRRYGLLANRFRKQSLPLARALLAAQGCEPLPPPPMPDCAPWHCPRCGRPMCVVELLQRRRTLLRSLRFLMNTIANTF